MRGVRDFLVSSRQAMIDYLIVVSTSAPDKFPTPGSPGGPGSDRTERLRVIESLRFRGANMPLLNREAIPLLPHLLDVPRHLAVISSAIVRRSNEVLAKHQTNGTLVDPDLHEFVNKCLEIEQQALKRVGSLVAHTREQRKRKASTSSGVVSATSSSQVGGSVRPPTSGDFPFPTTRQRPVTATSVITQRSRSSQAGGILRPSTSGDSSTTATRQIRPSTTTSVATQRSKSSLRQEMRPSTATIRTDLRPTFGSVPSRKRPSTTQGTGNTFGDTPQRPGSAGRVLSTPPAPIRATSEQQTFTLRGVTQTPNKEENTKSSPKFIRPILKRPSTAPTPSLLPMLSPSPDAPQMPAPRSHSVSRATGWSVVSSIISTPKKGKEAKKRLPRFSVDASGSENADSPGGEKRKGFLRGLLSRK